MSRSPKVTAVEDKHFRQLCFKKGCQKCEQYGVEREHCTICPKANEVLFGEKLTNFMAGLAASHKTHAGPSYLLTDVEQQKISEGKKAALLSKKASAKEPMKTLKERVEISPERVEISPELIAKLGGNSYLVAEGLKYGVMVDDLSLYVEPPKPEELTEEEVGKAGKFVLAVIMARQAEIDQHPKDHAEWTNRMSELKIAVENAKKTPVQREVEVVVGPLEDKINVLEEQLVAANRKIDALADGVKALSRLVIAMAEHLQPSSDESVSIFQEVLRKVMELYGSDAAAAPE